MSNAAYRWSPPSGHASAYQVNGLNQYTTVGGAAVTHDARGNLTSQGGRTFAYDVENRLTSVSGSVSMTLGYDPGGRLYETVSGSTTTRFLYDGDRLIAEYDGSGALLRRYVHGPGVDEPIVWYEGSGMSSPRWLTADHLGSVTASVTGAGAATLYRYGPYGEPDSWGSKPSRAHLGGCVAETMGFEPTIPF